MRFELRQSGSSTWSSFFKLNFSFCIGVLVIRASLVTQMVNNSHAMRETWAGSLCWEDPLEEAWQLTPVFLLGESHGPRSLVGYSPWGHKESDMTERPSTAQQ